MQIQEIKYLVNQWDRMAKNIVEIEEVQEFLKIYTKSKKVKQLNLMFIDFRIILS